MDGFNIDVRIQDHSIVNEADMLKAIKSASTLMNNVSEVNVSLFNQLLPLDGKNYKKQ